METGIIFRVILLILILSFAAHRGYYVKKHSRPEEATLKKREQGVVSKIAILGSSLFISSNWLVGLSWAGMTLLETISRVQFEESLMLEYFGDHYRLYMKKTGKLLPKII